SPLQRTSSQIHLWSSSPRVLPAQNVCLMMGILLVLRSKYGRVAESQKVRTSVVRLLQHNWCTLPSVHAFVCRRMPTVDPLRTRRTWSVDEKRSWEHFYSFNISLLPWSIQ